MILYYSVNNQILAFTIPTSFIEIFRYILIFAVIIITFFVILLWFYKFNRHMFPWICVSITIILSVGISGSILSGESLGQILLCCEIGAVFISFVLFIIYFLFEYIIKYSAKKLVKYLQIDEEREHTAIILPHNETRMLDMTDNSSKILIEGLKKYNEIFQIYFCITPDDFLHVLQNPNVKRLWIFGHGTRGGVCLNSFLTYAEFMTEKIEFEWKTRNIQLMEYVYQCHCNGEENRPLTDYLLEEKGLLDEKIDEMPNYLDTGVVNIKPLLNGKFRAYSITYYFWESLAKLHIIDKNINNIGSITEFINRYLAHLKKRVNDQIRL